MKFELKTENENNLRSFSYVFKTVVNLALIIIFLDFSLKLGTISKQYKIDYRCRLLSIEKSKPHFKKSSKLSNLKSKQQIWEFCREVIK